MLLYISLTLVRLVLTLAMKGSRESSHKAVLMPTGHTEAEIQDGLEELARNEMFKAFKVYDSGIEIREFALDVSTKLKGLEDELEAAA